MAQKKSVPELKHLDHVLVSETAIKRRVAALAEQINRAYRGKDLTVIAIVNGAIIFTSDLLRQLRSPLRLDCIRASSYHSGTHSTGKPVIVDNLKLDIKGHHVLVVDDILDTGNTLSAVHELLRAKQAASVRTCVLLDKKERRVVPFEAEYVGFEIPNEFVVGYGLDFNERYRNIPCIGVLKSKYYAGKI
ncbi:MAG: hypoxanthine phosphoribosyltransferase [Candidatus Didemnitutus sp.]|nr:hypoxanthine phosphoribosyltransferase [Candidatus Didemnitutus sp.]